MSEIENVKTILVQCYTTVYPKAAKRCIPLAPLLLAAERQKFSVSIASKSRTRV